MQGIDGAAPIGIAGPEGRQEADGNAVCLDDVLELLVQAVDAEPVRGHEQGKVVAADVAGDAVMGFCGGGQLLADVGEHVVAQPSAVPLVEQLEVLEVDGHQQPVGGRVSHSGYFLCVEIG